MKSIAAYLPSIITGAMLIALTAFFAVGRVEYCGQAEVLRPSSGVASANEAPTLAPPKKIVLLHVEADGADIEISWAEN